MKKLLLSAAALLAIAPAFARTLSPEEALARLSQDANGKHRTVALSSPRLVATGEYDGLTTYYIFSDNKSSMILSASDLAVPVIGYLDNAVTETTPMPSQLVWWLEKCGKAVKNAEDLYERRVSLNGSALTPGNFAGMTVKGKNNGHVRTASRSDISPLLKTTWDQDAPYNNLCPSGTVTGCVATAMAQVMKFHSYPDKGTGTVSVTYGGRKLSMDLDGTTLDWANMLDSYPSSTSGTAAQRTAVATLMKACGYSVDMSYGSAASGGSGAASNGLVPALVDNFKYDVAADYLMHDFYTDEDWDNIVYSELAAGRPVLYGGSGTGGGHQFVCDGYKVSTGTYHFNWGWSGAYDGYFALNALNPAGQGIGGNQDGFNEGQDIVIGVQKPVSGSVRPEAWICVYGGTLTGSASGRNVTLGTSSSQGGFFNMSTAAASFDIGFSLTDASGKTSYYSVYSNSALAVFTGFYTYNCAIPATVADGTYQLAPVYRIAGTSQWKPMKITVTDPQFVTLDIKGNTITVTNHQGPDPDPTVKDWTYSSWKTSTGFVAGEKFDVIVTITNPNEDAQTKTLFAAVLDNEGYLYSDYENYVQTVTLAGGQSKTVTFEGEIIAETPAGEYIVGIIYDNGTELVAESGVRINVESDVVASNVSVSSLSIPSSELTAGESFTATVKAKNTGSAVESLALDMLFCVDDPDDENSVIVKGEAGSKTISVPATGKDRSYTINCTTPADLASGNYYLCACSGNSVLAAIQVTVVNSTGAVDSIIADDDANVTYFDLQGRPVSKENMTPGIYIRKTAEKASKIIVK